MKAAPQNLLAELKKSCPFSGMYMKRSWIRKVYHFLMSLSWKPKRGANPVIFVNLPLEMKISHMNSFTKLKKFAPSSKCPLKESR